MNIPEIITLLTPVLKPYLGKALEGLSGEAGKSLWGGIKALFHKPEEQAALQQFESSPAESSGHREFIELLQAKLAASPASIERLKTIAVSGDQMINVQQFGEKSVAMRDNLGNINIS